MQCRWDAPDQTHSVIFDCETVNKLRSSVIKTCLTIPKRGAEAGGLLLGRIDPAKPSTVYVDGFQEIPCRHQFGPSYVLTQDERDYLHRAHEHPQRNERRVVGFYRSYTGRRPALDSVDQEVLRIEFADPQNIFLLIEPSSASVCRASFLFWNNRELPREPAYDFFALDADRMPKHSVAEQAPPEAHPLRPLPPARRSAARADASSHEWRRVFLSLFALMLLAGGAAFVYQLWQIAREPRWIPLRLDATRSAAGYDLRWDRSNPEVLSASRGVLTVTDGPSRQDVELSPEELRSGGYSYQTADSNMLFRLQLFGDGIKPVGDSIRVVAAAAPAGAAPAAAPPAAAAPVAAATPPSQSTAGVADRTAPPPEVVPSKTSPSRTSSPVATRQVQPRISSGVRARLSRPVIIPVEVHVNASGAVTKATAEGNGDGVYRYLAGEAARAARQWRFTPARTKGGDPVPSDTTIYFEFNSGT